VVERGERELPTPLHCLPPPHRHLLKIQAWREFPPPRPRGRPCGTLNRPPLPPCLLTFIISMVGLLPHRILRQGDPPQGAVCVPKILPKNAYVLKKQKLTQAYESEVKQTHPGAVDPIPYRDRAGARI
jgi:hypothetical protein